MQLRLATEAEKVARDRVTFPEWGTRLTLEQYLERERELRAHAFSRGMRTWLLAEGDEVLASCETFDNVSRVGGGEVGVTWSIASVYVEAQHRGRGHATRLMDLVAEEATRLGVQACVLFSDVGTRSYERSGFGAVEPAEEWVMSPLAPRGERDGVRGQSLDGSASHATSEALGEARDRRSTLELHEKLFPSPPPSPREGRGGALVLIPTAEQFDWAFARERLYARFLSRTAPLTRSARSGAAHATWAAYFKANELIILWLQPGSPEETRAVLDVARAEAHRCGLDRVRLWALPGSALPPDAAVQKRKDELAMVRACACHRIDTWIDVQRALWV